VLGELEARSFKKEGKKALKKARDFQIRKLIKKKKSKDAEDTKINNDIQIVKGIQIDSLLDAVQAIRNGMKPKIDRKDERKCQLIYLLLNSTPIKKFIEEFNKKMRKAERKRKAKKKKEQKREKEKASEISDPTKKKKKTPSASNNSLRGLREGMKVRGLVDGAESYGVFIKFVHKKNIVSGLCHISELANKFIKEPAKEFPVGTWVNAHILKLDPKKNRVSVSFKGLNDTSKMPMAKLSFEGGKENTSLESEFVTSLKATPIAKNGESGPNPEKRKKSQAVMAILKKVQSLKSGKKKNRLGQRDRKKLNDILYGGRGEEKDLVQEKIIKVMPKKRKLELEKSKGTKKDSSAIRKKQAIAEKEDLHPSWAAKRKQTQSVEFKGTRITFDDNE